MQNKTELVRNLQDLVIPTIELLLIGVGTFFGTEASTITDYLAP